MHTHTHTGSAERFYRYALCQPQCTTLRWAGLLQHKEPAREEPLTPVPWVKSERTRRPSSQLVQPTSAVYLGRAPVRRARVKKHHCRV